MTSTIFSGVRDPQKAYNWKVEFYGFGGGIQPFYAKATNIPMKTVDVIKKYYAGIRYSYPGQDTTPGILNVTFWDSEGLPTYEFFKKWYDLIQREDIINIRSTPEQYMKTASIFLLNRDGSTPGAMMTFNSIFPIEIGEAPLVYADSNEFTFDVRFHYWYTKTETKLKPGMV